MEVNSFAVPRTTIVGNDDVMSNISSSIESQRCETGTKDLDVVDGESARNTDTKIQYSEPYQTATAASASMIQFKSYHRTSSSTDDDSISDNVYCEENSPPKNIDAMKANSVPITPIKMKDSTSVATVVNDANNVGVEVQNNPKIMETDDVFVAKVPARSDSCKNQTHAQTDGNSEPIVCSMNLKRGPHESDMGKQQQSSCDDVQGDSNNNTSIQKSIDVDHVRNHVRNEYKKELTLHKDHQAVDENTNSREGIDMIEKGDSIDVNQNGHSTIQEEAKTNIPDASIIRRSTRKRKSVEFLSNREEEKAIISWGERIECLDKFMKRHGHCNMDKMVQKEDEPLRQWLQRQCSLFKQNKLVGRKIKELKSFGFQFQDIMKCTEHQEENVILPMTDTKLNDNEGLSNVTTDFKLKQNAIEHCGRSHNDEKWNCTFEELKRHMVVFHTCEVRKDQNDYLHGWINHQRKLYNDKIKGEKSSMTEERIAALKSINFKFENSSRQSWQTRIDELKEYKKQYGHVNVSKRHNSSLNGFVQRQRLQYKKYVNKEKTSLTEEKVNDLKCLGFNFKSTRNTRQILLNELDQNASASPTLLKNTETKISKRKLELTENEIQGNLKNPKLMESRGNLIQSGENDSQQTLEVASNSKTNGFDEDVVSRQVMVDGLQQLPCATSTEGSSNCVSADDHHVDGPTPNLTVTPISMHLVESENNIKRENNSFVSTQERHFKAFKDLTESEVSQWKDMLETLKEFRIKYGHCNVKEENPGPLYEWILTQRAEFRKRANNEQSTLTDDRYTQLAKLNFDFNYEFNEGWDKRFNEYHKFLIMEDLDWDPSYEQNILHYWVLKQRHAFAKLISKEPSSLNEERFKKLDTIDFDFYNESDSTYTAILGDEDWTLCFNDLKEFKQTHGNYNVSPFNSSNTCLLKWLVVMRHEYRMKILPDDKIRSLKALGFNFGTYKTENGFCRRIQNLIDFKQKYGHCNPRGSGRKSSDSFLKWVDEQRYRHSLMKHGKKDRVLKMVSVDVLIELGFSFAKSKEENVWNEKLGEISEFIAIHKHNNVAEDNEDLRTWVSIQRQLYNMHQNGKSTYLSHDRIDRLKNIGFDFELRDEDLAIKIDEFAYQTNVFRKNCREGGQTFSKRRRHLQASERPPQVQTHGRKSTRTKERVDYRENEENDRNIEKDSKMNETQLGTGTTSKVENQKGQEINVNITKSTPQNKCPASIDRRDTSWKQQLKNLDEFKKKYGHCNVCSSLSKNKPFVNWARYIRVRFREKKLPEDKIKELLERGFEFDVSRKKNLAHHSREKTFDEMFQELIAYKAQHNHLEVKDNSALEKWTFKQRQMYKKFIKNQKSSLDQAQVDKLIEIGFNLDAPVDEAMLSQRKPRRKKCEIKYVQSDDDSSDLESNRSTTVCNHQNHSANEEALPLPIEPLSTASPLPEFPSTRFCSWSYDQESRVLLANFHVINGDVTVTKEDKMFLFKMMERTDITVISENLAHGLNKRLWNFSYMKNFAGNEYHHKIRQFNKIRRPNDDNQSSFHEVDGFVSMKVSDYFSYLEKRAKSTCDNDTFSYTPFDKQYQSIIKPKQTGLYMIDFDMVKLLPRCYDDFLGSFKLPSILPGGENCMMNSVNASGRPFMGPNLYITPPAAFTHFHQDGYGTVDSGHLCLSGFNEVVMLRRLPENHKRKALEILNSKNDKSQQKYDALYGLPHSDGIKPPWPDHEIITELKRMNYHPSVFILKPGQCVHINKGRLHAFRKMSTCQLPKDDCHFDLRDRVISNEKLSNDITCVSVAWDWMYRGITVEGIHKELKDTLDCVERARAKGLQSLAIPETALFRSARSLVSECSIEADMFPLASTCKSIEETMNAHDLLKGIQPSLRKIVERHREAYNKIKSEKSDDKTAVPNSWQNPDTFTLDPYGDCDFFCKICFCELSNLYMHCDGCEKLLGKDFNICTECFRNENHLVNIQMHPQKNKRHATLNHTGGFTRNRERRCPCKNGPICEKCGYCLGCSCRCHKSFSMNFRFMTIEDEEKLLKQTEDILGIKGIEVAGDNDDDHKQLLNAISEQTNLSNEGNLQVSLNNDDGPSRPQKMNDVHGSTIVGKDGNTCSHQSYKKEPDGNSNGSVLLKCLNNVDKESPQIQSNLFKATQSHCGGNVDVSLQSQQNNYAFQLRIPESNVTTEINSHETITTNSRQSDGIRSPVTQPKHDENQMLARKEAIENQGNSDKALMKISNTRDRLLSNDHLRRTSRLPCTAENTADNDNIEHNGGKSTDNNYYGKDDGSLVMDVHLFM